MDSSFTKMLNQNNKKKKKSKTAEEESASTPSMSAAVPATASATAHTETERILDAIGSNDEMTDSREDTVDDELDGWRSIKPYNPFPSNPYGILSSEVSSERVAHRATLRDSQPVRRPSAELESKKKKDAPPEKEASPLTVTKRSAQISAAVQTGSKRTASAGESGQHATPTQSETAVGAGNSAAQSDAVVQATTTSAAPEYEEDTVESILARSEERAMAEMKTLKEVKTLEELQALVTAATESPPIETADQGTMTVDYDLTAEVHELREKLIQQAKELRGIKSRHGEAMKKEQELESVYEGQFEAREAKLTQIKNELASGAKREKDLKKHIKEREREKSNAEQRFQSEQRPGKELSDQLYGAHEKNNGLIDERNDLNDQILQICAELAEYKSHFQRRQANPTAPPALDTEKMQTLERRLDLARDIIKDMREEKEEMQRQLDEARAAPEKLETQLRNERESNRRLREQIARGGDSGKQHHGGGKGGGKGGGGFANWC
jgi:hypothetical protein